MTQASGDSGQRLRTHPDERFRAEQRKLDLEQAMTELLAEDRPSGHGHRQKTLYKHGGATIALFHFDAGGHLAPHRSQATVSIHVLDGHLRVGAGSESYELTAGQLVVLAPGVLHNVNAVAPSRMLLHVHLEASAVNRA